MAGAIPRDSAATVFEGMAQSSRGGGPWLIAWAGTQGDTLLLLRVAQQLKATVGHIPRTAPVMTKDILGYMIASSEAYLTLARGDTTKALSLFLALPDTACFTFCGIDALERAQLLEARGRPQEALDWLDRTPGGSMLPPLPSDVLRTLAHGRLQERLGQRDSAIEAYTYVTAVWARADSVLQPYVAEARAGLARLSAEPKP